MFSRRFICLCLPALGWCFHAQIRGHPESRLLATVTPPNPMFLETSQGKEITIDFQSVIPVFGEASSFIALLLPKPTHTVLRNIQLFCAGAGRQHRSRMRMFGDEHENMALQDNVVYQCEWPREEAKNHCFDVFIEDESGKEIGSVSVCHDPALLKTYSTAACVTSLWNETSSKRMNTLLMLPQWLEYNLIHGVEHFLVYTTASTDPTEMAILQPYFKAGLATRVHVEIPSWMQDEYSPIGYSTQSWFANDCMYRMKNHAKWLLPTVDVDEYLRPVGSNGKVVRKYDFDAIESEWVASGQGNTTSSEIPIAHSVSFVRYVFRYPNDPASEVMISSPWRAETTTGCNMNHLPKYAVKPALVNVITVHWPSSWLPGSVKLFAPQTVLVAHHYRTNYAKETPVKDTSLVAEVPNLNGAMQARFKSSWPGVYLRFCAFCPEIRSPSSSEVSDESDRSEMLFTGCETWMRSLYMIEQTQSLSMPFSE